MVNTFLKDCEKAFAASEFKTDCGTLIWFNYLFFGKLFCNQLPKILGGG